MLRLRKTLQAVLSSSPPPQDVRVFVHLCHQIATINLHARAARGGLRLDLLGLSVSDLALDSIAPLFTRDENGRFPKLIHYFNELGWETSSDAVLLSRLRQLIFSIAQQEIARIYQSADPSLSRIIENLRYAIGLTADFVLEDRFGHAWIVLRENDRKEKPGMPGEFLEAHLSARLSCGGSFREILREFHAILNENVAYFPGYPLVDFAIRIRTCVVRAHIDDHPHAGNEVHELSPEEITGAIESVVQALERELQHTYRERGGLDQATFHALLAAAGSILKEEYLGEDGSGERAFFEHLHSLLPEIDQEEYRKSHRSRLEYVVKLCRHRLLRTLRAELL